MLVSLLLLAVPAIARPLVQTAPASPRVLRAPPAVHTSWATPASPWPTDEASFTLVLRGENASALSSRIDAIADRNRGEWLSDDELGSYVRPHPVHLDHLQQHLQRLGVPPSAISYSRHCERVKLTTTAETVARIFPGSESLHVYARGTRRYLRTHSLTIPDELSYVQHVTDLTSFPPPLRSSARARSQRDDGHAQHAHAAPAAHKSAKPAPGPAACGANGTSVTGACIRSLYGTAGFTPPALPGSSLDVLIVGYAETYIDPTDVASYLLQDKSLKFAAAAASAPLSIVDGSGTNIADSPSLEGSLDGELVAGGAYGLNNSYLYYDEEEGSTFTESLTYILDSGERPGVVSISFAADEAAFAQSEATHLCSIVQQLTAQGTTVLFASGDGGVNAVDPNASCSTGFRPTYPSGCPYVLSVGATENAQAEAAPAWSGGGFSNIFPTPSYQNGSHAAYMSYLAAGNTSAGLYNTTSRGFPDVSAIGTPIEIVQNGTMVQAMGTSASTPIWAAVVALLNSQRRANGWGNIGFIHPALYSSIGALHDIQEGASAGCVATNSMGTGFPTGPGWDAVTGLGTPNFTALTTLLVPPPAPPSSLVPSIPESTSVVLSPAPTN